MTKKKKEVKDKGKSKNKIKNNKNKQTTITPTLPTTRYYMKSWGYYDKNIIIEQIYPNIYVYNNNGTLGLAEVEDFAEVLMTPLGKPKVNEFEGVNIDNVLYILPEHVYNCKHFYNTPDIDLVQKFVKGKYKPRSYEEIDKDIQEILKVMFDFNNPTDLPVARLHIAQSWLKPILNEFFFYGIDATRGGGKTTLGELIYLLVRHGFVGGDISSASIPRLVTELDLNIFIDEADQKSGQEDTLAVLRKGQRRNNPYVRCEGPRSIPTVYQLAGSHGFSFRSELEDAFMDRSLRAHTSKSRDSRLPTINRHKKVILKPLADELFLWFIQNIDVVRSSQVVGCYGVIDTDKKISREDLFDYLTQHLTKEERELLGTVLGRDNELTALCLDCSKILNLNMLEEIKDTIEQKKIDSESSENMGVEVLREILVSYYNKHGRELKEGKHAGCKFVPKPQVFEAVVNKLNSLGIKYYGTKIYKRHLIDLGFHEGLTIRNQRYEDNPVSCLIFTRPILRNLGVLKEEPKIETIKVKGGQKE